MLLALYDAVPKQCFGWLKASCTHTTYTNSVTRQSSFINSRKAPLSPSTDSFPTRHLHHSFHPQTIMRFTHMAAYALAAGSLEMTTALPASSSEHPCMSTMTATAVPSHLTSAPSQAWGWPLSSSTRVFGEWLPPVAAVSYAEQPSAVVHSVSYSYTNMPTATAPSETQEDNVYTAPRDKFGAVAVLATIGVVGAILCIVAVWAVIAHRNGRRPFACCGDRKKDNGAARGGSMDSEIPFAGAGRYFDGRPVSVQPQPFPMAQPQRRQPAQY